MKLIILAALCCFVLVINAATVPLTEEEINGSGLTREKRSPLILTALVGAGLVGAGLAGLAGAGLVGAKIGAGLGAGLGAKAGFAAGALAGSAARTYSSGSYYYGYGPRNYNPTDYEYRAQVRVRV